MHSLATSLTTILMLSVPLTAISSGSISSKKENRQQRLRHEYMMKANPYTGVVPAGIRQAELQYTRVISSSSLGSHFLSNTWIPYGPHNIGGRTRAFALDRRNPEVLIAGGASGGMWRSIDGGVSWVMTSRPEDMPAVTSVLQDIVEPDIWYFSTGEYTGTAGAGTGGGRNVRPRHPGSGLFRSTDNGVSWMPMQATIPASPSGFEPFSYITRLAADTTGGVHTLYAAGIGGIYSSTDRGNTWQATLAVSPDVGIPILPALAEIAVSREGTTIAVLPSVAAKDDEIFDFTRTPELHGIFRKTSGENEWVRVTPQFLDSGAFTRGVIAVSETEPSTMYGLFAAIGHPAAVKVVVDGEVENLDFIVMKSTDGGLTWLNISDIFSAPGSPLLSSEPPSPQIGYNLTLAVSPFDAETVVLGMTNMYATSDGFSTSSGIRFIGGYNPFILPEDQYEDFFEWWKEMLYPNSGWDHHFAVFHPSQPKALFTASDGGIRFTPNILKSDTVEWHNLNNGYTTSQFYALAIHPTKAGDGTAIGGMQDNGSYGTRDGIQWEWVTGGDGCTGVIFNDSLMIASSQDGDFVLFVAPDDNNLDAPSTRRKNLTPVRSNGFIVPIERDPHAPENSPRAYVLGADGLGIYSNLSMDLKEDVLSISPMVQALGIQDWTALAVSQQTPSRAWVAGNRGRIFRRDVDSQTAEESVIEITGNSFPKGFINCVAVDPYDDNHIGVVFSNYGIPSVFFSTDGGATWSDVSGNMEQNPDGSGNGPSIRWLAITGKAENKTYYLGTSVGLYSAKALGTSTEWRREAESVIGAAVVSMIRAREVDGFVAVATHGSGIFVNNPATSISQDAESDRIWVDLPFPVPASNTVSFVVHGALGSTITAQIVDARGIVVATEQYRGTSVQQQHSMSIPRIPKGTYFLRITTAVGVRTFVLPIQ